MFRANSAALALILAACVWGQACAGESPPADADLRALALQWFERMRTGAIDRTQLAPAYSAQLSDEAVRAMSQRLEAYEYGAAPLGAEIIRTETRAGETFAVVKLVFPRGDSANLLIGLDAEGKIAGLSLMSLAGD